MENIGSVEQILKNIYGTEATETIKEIPGLTGGAVGISGINAGIFASGDVNERRISAFVGGVVGGAIGNNQDTTLFDKSEYQLPTFTRPIGNIKYLNANSYERREKAKQLRQTLNPSRSFVGGARSFVGGARGIATNYAGGSVNYYADRVINSSNDCYAGCTRNSVNGLSGGARKTVGGVRKTTGGAGKAFTVANVNMYNTVMAMLLDLNNANYLYFVKTFCLENLFTSNKLNSAIYILPPKNEIDEMKAKINTTAPVGSIEYANFVRAHAGEIGYNRYLFIRFGNNTEDQPYRIDPQLDNIEAYPVGSFKRVYRGAMNGYGYWIEETTTKGKCEITNGGADGSVKSSIDFVGRCRNGVYVFAGVVPEVSDAVLPDKPTETHENSAGQNAFAGGNKYLANSASPFASTAFAGGYRNIKRNRIDKFDNFDKLLNSDDDKCENSTLKCFSIYDDFYNHDHETAAEHFLRCCDRKQQITKLNNGDIVYNAIYTSLSNPSLLNANDIGKESSRNIASTFTFGSLPRNFEMSVKSTQSKMKKLYKSCEAANDMKRFLQSYYKLYKGGDVNKIHADILTGYLRNSDGCNICAAYDVIREANQHNNPITACSIIRNAFLNDPLPSAFGVRQYPALSYFEDKVATMEDFNEFNDFHADISATQQPQQQPMQPTQQSVVAQVATQKQPMQQPQKQQTQVSGKQQTQVSGKSNLQQRNRDDNDNIAEQIFEGKDDDVDFANDYVDISNFY